jgi:hypothetical protein
MNAQHLWRWAVVAPLAGGLVFEMGCGQILKQSLYLGTLQFISGQVNTQLTNLVPLGDLITSIIAGQPIQLGNT